MHRQSPEGRRRKLRGYANVGLLCIDEVGYLPLDRDEANMVFQLISRRYERGSMIITSGLLAEARADLSGFVAENYGPGQMIVAAAGAVDHDRIVRLAERAFGGSAMQLVMRALDGRQTSQADLAEIRRLLDEHDRHAPGDK